MASGNAPKLAAFVLLLSVGAVGFAISKELGRGVTTSQRNAPAVSASPSRDRVAEDPASNPSSSALSEEQSPTSISDGALTEENFPQASSELGEEEPVGRDIDPEPRTIAAVTETDVSFSVLAVAIEAAGLTDMLASEGPFTIFAPTDDAFYALPPGQLEALLQPENRDQLVDLLTRHVVPGRVLSSEFKMGDMKTVEDDTVNVSLEGSVTVNGAHVVEIDIPASNGVIHAVDAIILPEMVSSAANAEVTKS